MWRLSAVVVMIVLLCSMTYGQENPRVEVFGGYQFARANTGLGIPGLNNFNLNGWNASATGYFNKYIGATADFGGLYSTPKIMGLVGLNTKFHTFMFGPTARLTNPSRLTPFAHALFGAGKLSASALGINGGETDFTWAAGGGLDAKLNNRFAVRVAQFDYLQSRVADTHQNNFRYSAGIVFKF